MRIGYNKVLVAAVIAGGIGCLALGIAAGTWSSVVTGAIVSVAGALFAVNPWAVITDAAIEVRNPLGMTLRRIPYGCPRELSVRGGKLFVATSKGDLSTGIGGVVADPRDLAAVTRWLAERHA